MPIKAFGKIVKAFAGTEGVLDASNVETTGASNAQTDLDNLTSSILAWKFNATVTDATNPGATFLAINNAAKDNATILSFNTTSNIDSARFDEALGRLGPGDGVYLQQRTAANKSIFYRVTGQTTTDGTKVNVPIVRERDQGTEFDNNAVLNVIFFYKGAGSSLRLVRNASNTILSIDATNPTTFDSALSSLTITSGDGFLIGTGGEPFANSSVNAEVDDVIFAISDSPSLTDIGDWAILRKPQSLPIDAASDLFLDQLTQTGNVFGFTSNVQIDRDNVEANYRAVIEANNGGVAPDLTSLRSKVDALFPLTPDVDILTDWADIYDPERAAQAVNIVPGYTSLADFRGTDASDHFESAGVGFATITDFVNYSTLTDDLHRVFGFRVQTLADKTLLFITDGATQIPFVDIRSNGNIRINNYTPARTQDEVVTGHVNFATLTSGTGTITVGGPVSTFTAPDYPANTTSQSRVLAIEFNVLDGGSSTGAGGGISLDIPDTPAASTNDVQHTFFLGWPSNRSVTATFRIATRVSGQDTLIDVSLISAPAGITFSIDNVDVVQSYTASVIIPRVDNFIILQDALGDFVLTAPGEFVLAFHPVPNNDTTEVVPVAIDLTGGTIDELNDALISDPTPGFDEIRIPDDIQFRTFLPDHFLRHIDLSNLLSDRDTQWVYALARLEPITEHTVTEPITLAVGSKVGSVTLGENAVTEVYQATGKGTTQGELVNNVTLPANYTNFHFVHITEYITGALPEWRSVFLSVNVLAGGDVETSEVIRIQGNTDLVWQEGSRVLTSQGGQTIYRAELVRIV